MTHGPDVRAETRARWERAAAGWEARRDAFRQPTQPVSVWLVEHVAPQPGHRVLELASGVGDTGLLAAELVRPGGSVLITDGADAMVEVARRRAAELGADNVEVRQMEAEWIDLPAASVDAVICRWGYMLVVDPEAALRDARRVLRPGGRVALAAWTPAEDNPWLTAPPAELVARGFAEPPPPDEPGPFALAEPGRIAALLEDAGFEDPVVEPLDVTFAFPSVDAYLEQQLAMSTRLSDTLGPLSDEDRRAVRDGIAERLREHTAPDGGLEVPGRTWVAAAGA